jgi:hypothetical protein
MTAGLINLISYGVDDLYLTGSPQITFFKMVYRRHTNFAKENYMIEMGNFNFNDEITINVPNIADLMSNVFLNIEVPEINFYKTDICTNLSSDEIRILNNDIPSNIIIDVPINTELITIENLLSVYGNVKPIISQFCEAYRTAKKNKDIITQSIDDYILEIQNSVIISSEDILIYNGLLDDANNFENSKGNKVIELNYILSNVGIIINNIDSFATINEIFNSIERAISYCKKVSKYFFGLEKRKTEINNNNNSKFAKFAWNDKINFNIIDYIDVNIGGERIDRHYGDFMNLWYEFTGNVNQTKLFNSLTGNKYENTQFDRLKKSNINMNIPLSFWFCKKMGLAFPLIALQYSEISFTIKLNSFEKCAMVEKLPRYKYEGDDEWTEIEQLNLSDIWDNMGLSLSGNLSIEYIFLDVLERKRFAQSAHEYLIETTEQIEILNVSHPKNIIILNLYGPTKELFWFAQKTDYVNDNSFYKKYNFKYDTDTHNNPFKTAKLLLTGKTKFDFFDPSYFDTLQPFTFHTSNPSTGLNMYSLCLFPEEHQPSSTCNFSKIDESKFICDIDESMFSYKLSDINPLIVPSSSDDITIDTTVNIKIYSRRYVILRIIGGVAGVAYKYPT